MSSQRAFADLSIGANIPGKKRCLRFFFGGMQAYRELLDDCAAKDYKGFKPLTTAAMQ